MESQVDAVLPLRIEGLRKRYGRRQVLRGVDLTVPKGAVYGLVGLNGSGKTTTIRCALGLSHGDGGSVSILGLPAGEIHRTAGRVGAVFDSPCLHPDLTVRRALEHARMLCGPRSMEPAEAEALLGLERWGRVKVRRLSLGNARRASIARALIGRPSLLVLDEPFSGLDAGGVDDVLALVGRLNRSEGTSFLLASHQLPYLEGICTHVAVLHEGRIALDGPLGTILGARRAQLVLRTSEPGRALDLLRARPGVASAGIADDGRLRLEIEGADPAALNRDLVEAGFSVSELLPAPPSLEAAFREVVGRRTR
jgi:ABC-type multidrug transport system ATPase subunit